MHTQEFGGTFVSVYAHSGVNRFTWSSTIFSKPHKQKFIMVGILEIQEVRHVLFNDKWAERHSLK